MRTRHVNRNHVYALSVIVLEDINVTSRKIKVAGCLGRIESLIARNIRLGVDGREIDDIGAVHKINDLI